MSLKGVESLGKKGISGVSNVIGANKRNIELFMVAIIVVEYLPHDIFGIQFKKMLKPLMDPIKRLIRHPFVHLFLFVCLIYSCCIKRDMNLFLLLTIFMMTYRIHHEVQEDIQEGRL
tara:strand:- start:15 stop:365 length:351 start_codon:yes stop_codon:yes gene_type:complete